MPQKPKRPRRREYLNDFHPDATGKQVYCGTIHSFRGSPAQRARYLRRLSAATVFTALITVLPEVFPSVEMSRSFITVLPWMGQVAAAFTVAWAAFRLIYWSGELRDYVYHATVPALPRRVLITCGFAFFTFAAQTVWLCVCGTEENLLFVLIRPACSLLCGGFCLFFYRMVRHDPWTD